MKDSEIVERLNVIHDALDCLRELSYIEDLKAQRLSTYLELVECAFDPLHEALNKEFEQRISANGS